MIKHKLIVGRLPSLAHGHLWLRSHGHVYPDPILPWYQTSPLPSHPVPLVLPSAIALRTGRIPSKIARQPLVRRWIWSIHVLSLMGRYVLWRTITTASPRGTHR